jgi:peptide/nickel transport system substrate-binding protein
VAGVQPLDQLPFNLPAPRDPLTALVGASLHASLLHPEQATAELQPGLAASWKVEGNRATFTLRNDATWSDGSPLQATEVAAMLLAVRDQGLGRHLYQMTEVKAADERTLVLTFAEPAASCAAVSEAALWPIQDWPAAWPPKRTSGAYHVVQREAEAREADSAGEPPSQVVWEFVPHAETTIAFGAWEYQVISDSQQLVAGWWAGEVDLIIGDRWLNGEQVPTPPTGGKVVSLPGPDLASLVFRLDHPLLNNIELRRALALGTDVAALYRQVYQSPVSDTLNTLLPPGHWAAPPPDVSTPDTVAAIAKLKALGWQDPDADGVRSQAGTPLRLELSLALSTDPRWEALALALRQQWAKLGVELVPRYIEYGTLEEWLHKGYWDVALLAYNVPLDPDQGTLWQPGDDVLVGDTNVTGYANTQVASLFQQAAVLPGCSTAERAPLYHQAWQALNADMPMRFLFPLPQRLFLGPGLQPPAAAGAGGWAARLADWQPR